MDTYFASITRADFDLLIAWGMIGSVIMFELFNVIDVILKQLLL